MVIVLALLSSAILGSADFIGGVAARRARSTVVVVWSNAAGLLCAIVIGAVYAAAPGLFCSTKRWPSAPCRFWPRPPLPRLRLFPGLPG